MAALCPVPETPESPKIVPPDISLLLTQAKQAHTRGHLRPAAEFYRQILFAAPANPAALLGLSFIARQTNQPESALHLALATVAVSPRSAIAWSNLGDIQLVLALTKPACLNHAQASFTRALTLDSTFSSAHFGLGNVHAQREDFAAALPCFHRAADLDSSRAELAFALAFAYGKLARHRTAIKHYSRALACNPCFASAWLNLGVELVADGRDQLAIPCYAQAIQAARRLSSDSLATELSAHLNLGHLARAREDFFQAQASYQRAFELAALHPHRLAEVHLAFASMHLDQQHFPQAWISLRAAESSPHTANRAEILNTRGILLLGEHAAALPYPHAPLIEEAIAAFRAAETLGHKTAGSNRGNALLRLGRVAEALQAHRSSLERDPSHPGVRYNLALTQIRSGNFAEGWPNYEIRWDFREIHPRPRPFTKPRWHGGPLPRASSGQFFSRLSNPKFSTGFPQISGLHDPESSALFLYAEQGLGDTLQFVRYLPLVVQRLPGVPIFLEVQPPLLRLLVASLAGLPVQLLAAGDPLPPFTHHCPLMSLPAVFATTLATVPAQVPYLCASAAAILPPQPELTIGLNWAGNPHYRADRERSTTLSTFEPLLRLPGIRWVSLQKGEAARQISSLPPHLRPIDSGSQDRDLADTAATIANLDLVVTTDSAVAHLAGALGRPLWLLLPWQSDWRWMQQIETTPWYPTARLWRQSTPNNWPELITRLSRALLATRNLPSPMAALVPATSPASSPL
jgi:tetratricopeptide (TPR) repeat protein